MANTSNCDFCCDRDAIKVLSNKYSTAFEELVRQKTEVDAALYDVKSSGCLKGHWYDTFLTHFQAWEAEYTRLLSGILLLNACLLSMDDGAAMLIENRDNLNKLLA